MKTLLFLLLLIPSLSWGKFQNMIQTDITVSMALEEGYEIISVNSGAADGAANFVHLYHKKQKKYLVCLVFISNSKFKELCGISKWRGYVPEDLTKVD